MWRHLALLPQTGSLCYTEAVLLVDDDQPQARELHRIFQHGVGANEELHIARTRTFYNRFAFLFALDVARQQFHANRHILQQLPECRQMLLCQDLRRGHQTSLVAVAYGDEHQQQRHQRLAASHVALQQTVHLFAGLHVVPHLADDPLLRTRQLKREVVFIE